MGEIAGDSGLQSTVLEELADAANYRRWVISLALPFLGDDPLEIGSGHGDHAQDWADLGVTITASDADDARVALLHDRLDRKSTRLNSSHANISYAVFC